jgi:hypothetical protein
MTIPPIVTPLLQWSDANGTPYANGTITTYIVGTGTPKQTWADPDQTSPNANPIVLDAAGRSQMWGDGSYRLVLHDAAGNLIADFPATTLVSAAMYPVVNAPTIADAVSAMGIDTLISDEATARAAADAAEQNARIAADNNLTASVVALQNGLAATNNNVTAETTRATNAENNLQTQVDNLTASVASGPAGGGALTIQSGHAATDLSGHTRVLFAGGGFPTAVSSFVCSVMGAAAGPTPFDFTLQATADAFGADVYALQGGLTATTVCQFSWFAAGN